MVHNGKTIGATKKSLRIIELIKEHDGVRLAEVVAELDVSKSTAHSHLNTLRQFGYVRKEGEIYHLSFKLFHIGLYTRNRDERFRFVSEKVLDIADRISYAVDFDIETNGRMMTLFHEADASTEVGLKEGDYFYVHTSSTGKAVLAELSEERVHDIIDRWGMPAETESTITSRDNLMDELAVIQERGYAIIDEEWLNGLRAVGVAVTLPNGSPLGALSIGGPTYRLTDSTIEDEVAPLLLEATGELEGQIGTVLG